MKHESLNSLLVISLLVTSGSSMQLLLCGTIGRLLTDEAGAVILSATVTVADLDRNQSSVRSSHDGGLSSFHQPVADNYQVSIDGEGFSPGVSRIVVSTTNDILRDGRPKPTAEPSSGEASAMTLARMPQQ